MTSNAIIKRLDPSHDGIHGSYLLTNGGWSGVPRYALSYPVRLFGDTVQALEHLKQISKPDEVYVIEFTFTKE